MALEEARDLAVALGLVGDVEMAGVRPQRQLGVRDRAGQDLRVARRLQLVLLAADDERRGGDRPGRSR
jgi:hypothetical protein